MPVMNGPRLDPMAEFREQLLALIPGEVRPVFDHPRLRPTFHELAKAAFLRSRSASERMAAVADMANREAMSAMKAVQVLGGRNGGGGPSAAHGVIMRAWVALHEAALYGADEEGADEEGADEEGA